MRFDAILFDFDGVILESEAATNRKLAALLSEYGHPTTPEDAMTYYMGLSGDAFVAAIERRIGAPLPAGFVDAQEAAHESLIDEGVAAVPGAIDFIRSLPADLPRAIVSSSSTHWIITHLDALGLRDAFGDKIFSGREHVARGKPDPALYLHAAAALGVAPGRCAVIEDSVTGVTGALAAGMRVIGLCAASHCLAGHAVRLREAGVEWIASSYDEAATLLDDASDDLDRQILPGT